MCVCFGRYVFICISQEVRTWKYNSRSIYLSSSSITSWQRTITRKILSRGAFVLFQNVWKSSIYRIMEDVFCQFLGSAALSESQWNQKDKSASALLLQFGVHFLTHFPPLPHTAATCRLVSTGPFRNLLWFHPLLIALWFYAEFQTN